MMTFEEYQNRPSEQKLMAEHRASRARCRDKAKMEAEVQSWSFAAITKAAQ